METKYILYDKTEGVATITINRPEALNALNKDVIREILGALKDAETDEAVHVIVITGAGEKSFCAGADLSQMKGMTPLKARELSDMGYMLCHAIEFLGKPVIAAINGYALGGGLEMAMACDLRVASDKARIGQTEVNVGLIPGWGGTQRLPRLVGKTVAKEMIYTGKMIDAQTALQIGLINKVFPADQFAAAAKEYTKELASKPPVAVKVSKALIDKGLESSLDAGLALEREGFGIIASTEDLQEGVNAFFEKRKPNFRGR